VCYAGVHTGLATTMRRQLAPFLVSVHCTSHRLNLAAAVLQGYRFVSLLSSLLDLLSRCVAASLNKKCGRFQNCISLVF